VVTTEIWEFPEWMKRAIYFMKPLEGFEEGTEKYVCHDGDDDDDTSSFWPWMWILVTLGIRFCLSIHAPEKFEATRRNRWSKKVTAR
jgi:hypothetical protein